MLRTPITIETVAETTPNVVRTEVPRGIHDPNVPPSAREAFRRYGLGWALNNVQMVARGKWQLRHCDEVGRWVRVRGEVKVHNEGRIIIGDRVRFLSRTIMSELATWQSGVIEIGTGSGMNYGLSISAALLVRIGQNCLFGTNVNIMDTTFHSLEDRSWNLEAEPIVIEDNVWLGNRTTIMKGVTIGEGAVVAPGSVVTRDVPARSMVVGVPARVVKHL